MAVYEYGLGLCAQSAIRNRRVTLEFKAVKASTLAIAGRSISTLTQGVGDLYQMYLFSRENQVDYNLAYIPGDVTDTKHGRKKTPPRLGNTSWCGDHLIHGAIGLALMPTAA